MLLPHTISISLLFQGHEDELSSKTLRTSTLLNRASSCPGLDRVASSHNPITNGAISTTYLSSKKLDAYFRFRCAFRLAIGLYSPPHDSRRPIPTTKSAIITFLQMSVAVSPYNHTVSGAFHPFSRSFSTFPHGTISLSVLVCI